MPWPVSSRITWKPRFSTSVSTALPIALRGAPATAASIPLRSAALRGGGEAGAGRLRSADRDGDARVGVVAVELGRDVDLDDVAVAQPARSRHAVDDLVVDRDADRAREAVRRPGPDWAPWRAKVRAATASRSAVVMPARTARRHSLSVAATTAPAALRPARSAGESIDMVRVSQGSSDRASEPATRSSSPCVRSPATVTTRPSAIAQTCGIARGSTISSPQLPASAPVLKHALCGLDEEALRQRDRIAPTRPPGCAGSRRSRCRGRAGRRSRPRLWSAG